MRFGLLLSSTYHPPELIRLARLAEALGYNAFWYPDEKFFRDVYVGLALVASHTSRIQVGPCVTDPYARHPLLTAAAIGSLAEIAPGRTVLGLGAGGRGFAAMGIERRKPAVALREAMHVIRAALRGETFSYEGQVIQARQARLDFTPAAEIPIIIGGGHGPRVLQVAGELADGVMIHSYASRPGLQQAISLVQQGMERASGDRRSVELISRVDFCVADDGAAARRTVKPRVLAALRASYPELAYLQSYPELRLPERLREVIELTRVNEEAKRHYNLAEHVDDLVPDEFVTHLAVAGTPESVSEQLRSIAECDVDQITIKPMAPPSGTVEQVIDRFMQVAPAAAREGAAP